MRNKLMITISDIHGSKQYTVHELIRRLVLWIIVSIIVLFAMGVIVIKALSSKVDDLDQLTLELKNRQQSLTTKNKELQDVKILLTNNINNKSQQLESMDEKLAEIEDIIGIKPDISNAFEDRAQAVKKKGIQNLKAANLSISELSLLNKSIPIGLPLKNYKRISDKFGYRIHPITKKKVFHFGIDYTAKTGTSIYATADGVVAYSKNKGGYGKFLLINNPFGFSTAFGHLSKFAVKTGDYVYQGDLIGYVGNTGRSTGSHLHYEIRYLHKWLNPKSFVTWSQNNYKEVMKKEHRVKWEKLLEQLHRRFARDLVVANTL